MVTPLGRNLLERRIPQYLAAYLGVSWGVIEFFAFLEDRFLLSPYLTDLVMVALALLLPSVVLVIYFHGRAGPDRWHRVEKVAIPANLALAGVVLFGTFGTKDLGAVTTTVRAQDEEGNAVERVVVKNEFRKTLAVFTPYADSTDANTAWLGTAVLNGLLSDLYQDMFLDVRPWMSFRDRVREAGFASDAAVPRALKRSMVAEMHVPFFVDGSVARVESGYRLTLALNDARRGRILAERVYHGADLLALIDSASVQLRRDLDVPGRHIEDTPDMPASEYTTASMEAQRHYSQALDAWMAEDDYAAARVALDSALAVDPEYADAAFTLYNVCALAGDLQCAMSGLTIAMNNLYRLPDRAHYRVKAEWYAAHQDLPKMYAVYEMWAELYPQDIEAQSVAAQIRIVQNDKEGALRAYQAILELDPTRIDLWPRIGALHEGLSDTEAARQAYERYVGAAPEDPTGLTSLAGLYRRTGQHDEARALYERAQLLKPDDISIAVALASLDRDVGRFDEAVAGYEDALDDARTSEQRYSVLSALGSYYEWRGAMTRALEYNQRALQEAASSSPPLVVLQGRLVGLADYVHAGQPERALTLLDSLTAQLQPPQDAVVPIGRMAVFEALGRPDDLEAAVADGRAMLERTGMRALEGPVIFYGGRVHEMRGEWQAAIEAYERERENDPTDYTVPSQLGRCYRELGQLDRAEDLILQTLRLKPSNGRAHYDLALVYERMARNGDAVSHLRHALDTWASADEGFPWAQRARAKLEELTAS
ncbi:MAG: tetratricopeptide repeat protein [Gemmatimonadetes bacterium]|nr:tetratricopeptide repeat protein [Gemmatimonadota bacterium]